MPLNHALLVRAVVHASMQTAPEGTASHFLKPFLPSLTTDIAVLPSLFGCFAGL
jgi:hypothetical protein